MELSESAGTVTGDSWTEEETKVPVSGYAYLDIRENASLNTAPCPESMEMCPYCTNSYSNKIDALVHTATHAKVLVERLPLNSQNGLTYLKAYLGKNGRKEQPNDIDTLTKEPSSQATEMRNVECEESLQMGFSDRVLKAKQQLMKLTGRRRRSRLITQPCKMFKRVDERTLAEENDSNVDQVKRNNAAAKKLLVVPSKNYTFFKLASKEGGGSLHKLVTNCKVNLEPMICDVDTLDFMKTVGQQGTVNGLVTDDSDHTSRLLSKFTGDCGVVPDNPTGSDSVPDTKAVSSEQDAKKNLLNNFTSECKVILGPQMIVDEETSEDAPLSLLARPEPAAPVVVDDDDDDDEPVTILDQNDYDSLVTPLICYCPRCPQVFPNRFGLYKHNTSHLHVKFRAAMPITVSYTPVQTHNLEPQDNADTSNKYTVQCALCKHGFSCVKNFLRHAAKHVKETLSIEERRSFPNRSQVFKECETCYKAAKSLRRLIGHLRVEGRSEVQCSVCKCMRSEFRLFWKPRSSEIKPVVIDLCDDEPTDGSTSQGRLHSQTGSMLRHYLTTDTDVGSTCSAWNQNADPEMATLIPNPPLNNDHDILQSILGPSDHSLEDIFILGGPDPDESLKKDYINTVWEHDSVSEDSNPISVGCSSNTANTQPDDWDLAIAPTVVENYQVKCNTNAQLVGSNRHVNNGSTKADAEKHMAMKERILFEDDFVVKTKATAHKGKRGRPPAAKNVVPPKQVKKHVLTNAMRLKNIQIKLKSMKQRK